MSKFDVVVIGGGPGGYIAAIRAAQLGFKVACVDAGKNKTGDKPALGGTCLNVGCIPSKALLESSEAFHKAKHEIQEHGITVDKVKIDVPKMIARKDAIVDKLTGGVGFLLKKNKIENIHGFASFSGKNNNLYQIEVNDGEKKSKLETTHVIIATGSKPRQFPSVEIDNVTILDNVGALNLETVPKQLGMIGAGVIGLEMSSVWNRLGSEVTILEAAPDFLPMADQQISKEAFKIFTKEQKLDIKLGAKVVEITPKKNQVKVKYEIDGKSEDRTFDKLIIAIGRVPNTDNLKLDTVGVDLDERGFIKVNDDCHTQVENIWAIGDVVRGPMLAHKASEEGVAVAERIAGQKPHVNLDIMPSILYTFPEIAWVGKTEEELKESGVKYKKGISGFGANGRALALQAAKGTVKILADEKTDRILGIHMIGPMVSELLTEAVVALEFSASSEDIARIVHAHPTLSEVIHEASLAVDKRPLNG